MGLGLAAGLALPLSASATNGYFAHGYGTANKALAGAGVAMPQDALAPATNPAGITKLGHRMDLGLALFSPQREYAVAGTPAGPPEFGLAPGTYDSDSNYFLIPSFGYNRPLDDKSAFAVAVYGNGGMNTDWPNVANSGTYYAGPAGVDLMQLFVAPTYAREVSGWSIGASAILAFQAFEAEGIGSFQGVSNDPNNLTNKGHDTSYGGGVRLGLLAPLSNTVNFGASFQSQIYMSEFDDYAGLFAEQGDFDIPANFTVGLAIDTSDRSTLLFDVQYIMYGSIPSIANPMQPNFNACAGRGTPTDPNCLGGDNGIGFGWKDMTIFKLGYQWETADDWTWRLGYSYGRQPIRSTEVLFNILAPGVIEHHFTGGFSKKIGDGVLNFAAMYAPEKSVRGPNPLQGSSLQTVELSMYQFELEASYTWFFD
jgi:long-chain fatty acid transport protein